MKDVQNGDEPQALENSESNEPSISIKVESESGSTTSAPDVAQESESKPLDQLEQSEDSQSVFTPVPLPVATEPILSEKKSGKFSFLKRKKIMIPMAAVLVLAGLLAVPATRYPLLGAVIKKDVVIVVQDASSKAPISDVTVVLNGKESKTDAEGKAEFVQIPIGPHEAKLTKKYYADGSDKIDVAILGKAGFSAEQSFEFGMKATGRQVNVTLTNKINGKPLAGADIKAGEAQAKTAEDGKVVLVVSPDATKQKVSVILDGYNLLETEINVKANEVAVNNLEMTPSGKIYFLSKKSGKIDLVKTNLDGTDRKVVLPGTGKEQDRATVLLASRDWKYLALLSRRDSELPKLYLFETATEKLTVIDEGEADFTLTGWTNESFVYQVYRKNVKNWQPKQGALKAYNASSKTLKTLNETSASGTGYATQKYETIQDVFALDNEVVFTKYGYGMQGSINTIKVDGTGFKKLKTMISDASVASGLYKPKEIYFTTSSYDSKSEEVVEDYFEYTAGGSLEAITKEEVEKVGGIYSTFLLSPSGKKNFWSEERDGRPVLFVGDENGANEKEYTAKDEKYKQYGWYTDDYLLVSVDGSELFITSAEYAETPEFIKITDYHKPQQIFFGYGGGYGGF